MYDGASNIPDGCCSSAILISSGAKIIPRKWHFHLRLGYVGSSRYETGFDEEQF